MSMPAGFKVGAFEVQALIGRGGMGEVYRARDLTLQRDIALKLLPDTFAHDAERLARFEREARLLATLNHPNIATVHGFEHAGHVQALVMELVEGPTLADRIAEGPLPTGEALGLARQVAQALEAAHEHGVMHRDLKPANVKVRPDGTVKVLDFGLAKAFDPVDAGSNITNSPTITSPAMTQQGLIIGTAAYMAPEQARGRVVDKRADIWAFGALLYEMLTGRRAFDGEDVTATLAAVIRADPDWTALPADLSPTVRTYLMRALEKDPRQRLRDIGDFGLALSGALDPPVTKSPARTGRAGLGGLTAAAAAAAGLLIGYFAFRQPAVTPAHGEPGAARFSIELLPGRFFGSNVVEPFAITRDGRHIIFNVAAARTGGGATSLYVRALDRLDATEISAGEPIGSVFVAPDNRWIGFNRSLSSDGGIGKLRITGGPPAVILKRPVVNFAGASWGPRGTIAFALNDGVEGIQMMPDSGGTPAPLTKPRNGEGHLSPQFLPDGRHVLFMRLLTGEPSRIEAVNLETGARRSVIEGAAPRFVPSGHLLFTRDEKVWAVAFDPARLELRGEPLPVLEDLQMTATGRPQLSVSETGTLVYANRRSAVGNQLTWVSRDGSGEALPFAAADYWMPRLSPDGRRLAVGIGQDLWVLDLERLARTRVTFGQTSQRFPFTWTSDGQALTFAAPAADRNRIYRVSAEGGTPTLLLEGEHPQWPTDWSPDGNTLAYYVNAPDSARDLWTAADSGRASPQLFLRTPFEERAARFSPDGAWVTYVSNESGTNEVYVRPFSQAGGQVAISAGGGTEPVWAPSGRELLYRFGADVYSVAIETSPALRVSPPRRLFSSDAYLLELGGVGGNPGYDVHPDGRRLLMIAGRPVATTVNIVINWFEELKRLVPTPAR